VNHTSTRRATSPDTDLVARLGLSRQMPPGRFWWILGAAAVLLIIAFVVFSRSAGPEFITQRVIRGPLSVVVSATGTLAPRDQVDVGAEISGRIEDLNVDFNDHVRKGQTLAKLNTEQLEAQLAQARATLAQAHATLIQEQETYPRDLALAKNNAMSKQDLDNAKANLLRARANVDLASAQVKADETLLSKATIFSPIDGVVLDRKVSRGQTVVAAMQTPVLFTLASDLSQMELDVDIDEADVGLVRPGQSARFTVDAYPGRNFTAKLVSIHSAPKTVQGVVTYQGVLLVSNPNGLLKPGMTATAQIVASSISDALLVPNSALRFTPPANAASISTPAPSASGNGRVWVQSGSRLAARDLKLGATDGRYTQVLGGEIAAGDHVATDVKTPKGSGG